MCYYKNNKQTCHAIVFHSENGLWQDKSENHKERDMNKYIMALDAGTTSNRCILFDTKCSIVSVEQKPFTQIFPQPGWVEHNPEEIWNTQYETAKLAMDRINAKAEDIVAIGITNQRETVIVWDKKTGEPVYNAIVWQCRRSAEECDKYKAAGYSNLIHDKTGLIIDAYSSASKIKWILDNVEGAREKADRGELLTGTVDTWLIWKLTGGKIHVTDYTNASRTMLFNIKTLEWDEELLKLFKIPASMLPEVKPSSYIYGETSSKLFKGPIKIAGIAGDQQAALFGQACFNPGDTKNTYGTGCFMLMNVGDKPVYSSNGLLTTIAWGLDGKVEYALEGSIFVAGAANQWLCEQMHLVDNVKETEKLAREVEDTNGCYVVPAFTGLGAPYWNQYARGCIVGITRGVNRNHVISATLESLAFLTNDVMKAMKDDSGIEKITLKVDGGASANNLLMQMQSDVIQSEVIRPRCVETTAMGAAYLAGLASGYWTSKADVINNWEIDKVFTSQITKEECDEKIKMWHKAVTRALDWAKED